MGFVINNNLAANNSYRNLNATQNDLSKSLEKLSTGLRINRAGDDAAGLSISEGLKSQVTGSAQAARNAQDGISVIQTAEGALTEVHSILQRMRDLAVQAGNDSNNADARTAIKTEVDALGDELTRIGDVDQLQRHQAARRQRQRADVPGRCGGARLREDQIVVDLVSVLTIVDSRCNASQALTFDTAANALASRSVPSTPQIKAISTQRVRPRCRPEPPRAHHQVAERCR